MDITVISFLVPTSLFAICSWFFWKEAARNGRAWVRNLCFGIGTLLILGYAQTLMRDVLCTPDMDPGLLLSNVAGIFLSRHYYYKYVHETLFHEESGRGSS